MSGFANVSEQEVSKYKTVNPATGELVAEFPSLSDLELGEKLTFSASAQLDWACLTTESRAALVGKIAEQYRENRNELAQVMTLEMGKPITQALGEVDLCISIYEYYAEHGVGFLAPTEFAPRTGGKARVDLRPLGLILGIMPWNFPHYQVARVLAPNLTLGNALMLKHASNCPQTSALIEKVVVDAGVPRGIYTNLYVTNDQVAQLIADDRVQGVSFTGSEPAGIKIATLAGSNLKKAILELGGSDPFIVLKDADIEIAAEAAVRGRVANAGQSCNAAKRMIVVSEVYDEFMTRFRDKMKALNPSDPTLKTTFLGPLSSRGAAEEVQAQLDHAVQSGAFEELSGGLVDDHTAYMRPAILSGITSEMPVYREELFGPVALVFRAEGPREAVQIANDTPFGLGAAVFGKDESAVDWVASQLECGMVTVNEVSGSLPDLPFGGIKRSGIGRELGKWGIEEFANLKLQYTP